MTDEIPSSNESAQIEAIDVLANSFDKKDYFGGKEHRATVEALAMSIATADSSDAKIEGLEKLGDYSARTSSETGSLYLQIESVQEEALNAIARAAAEDTDVRVKDAALDQIARTLNIKDFRNGDVHGGAVDAIRIVATSITVKEGDSASSEAVKKAVGILGDYAKRDQSHTGSDYLQVSLVQEQAKKIIQLVSSTAGVEKFEDLHS